MYLPGWKAKKGDIVCSVAPLTGAVVKGTEVLVIGTSPRIGQDALLVMEKDFRAHEKLQDHPVAEEKIKRLEEQGDEVLREQKTLRKQMRRANQNISAICQAIPGARCK